MAFLDSLDKVRRVEWGHSYLWDARFLNPTPPAPFADWFPAQTMGEDIFALESYTFDARGGQFSVPLRRGQVKRVEFTFFDDVNNTLLNWFEEWVNEIILDRKGTVVSPLELCVRQLEVVRLNHARETVGKPRNYWVYPEGKLVFTGDSSSGARSLTVSLVIVGTIGNTKIS
jgi:hypothetical protein